MSLHTEIGKPEYKDTVIVKDAENKDIIRVLESQYINAVRDAAPIAYRFKGKDRTETARNIYTALKNDITYEKDGFGVQDIRLPKRFWHTAKGDCKSFTLNTLAIWGNLYPEDQTHFKYASYSDSPIPSHVYAVIKPKGEKQIIIDGCWTFFNSEKTPSFTQQSKSMDVRVLSDNIADTGLQFTPEAKQYYSRIYHSLPTAAAREDFKNFLRKKMMLEINKEHYVNGTIDAACMYENICAIEGIGKVKHKGKGKGKKFLHWFNAAALFVGRAAFLLFVTTNVNGLASKLQQLHKWGKDAGIMNTWYTLGGNQKKLLQIINRGATKKKLFLSKAAKHKYEQRYGALSPNEIAFEKGVHGVTPKDLGIGEFSIGVLPALAAAAVAVVPILGALLPKMIQGFRAAAPAHPEAAKWAAGTINEGADIVAAHQANGYNPTAGELANGFLPAGQHAQESGQLDPRVFSQSGAAPAKGGGVVFDISKFYLPIAGDDTPAPADANTTIPGGSADGSIQVETYKPEKNGLDKFTDTMNTLGPLLNNVAQVGLHTAGAVMSQSQNPNIRKWGGAMEGAEGVLTAQALRKAGYANEARFHEQVHAGGRLNMASVLFYGGLLYVGAKVIGGNSAPAKK